MGRRKGRPIHGWLVVDKPAGPTSAAIVNRVRWMLQADKAGHAGTLDPAATGLLAVALGEATKTIPFVESALKSYIFRLRWGRCG
jgi:tRNA pseudouridine55 synthase